MGGQGQNEAPLVEVHQIGNRAVGHRLEFEHWWNIEPQPLANYLTETAEALLAYFRDYHHFGDGQGIGLEHRWYFCFLGTPPPTTIPGDRYYDARDRGYGEPRQPEQAKLTVTREGTETLSGVYTVSAQHTVGEEASARSGWGT